jgi:bacteriocin biosynthesis cyclodehydratase domain-containing protein
MAQVSLSREEIARSRPRIRRDVLFTRTPSGVLFHNAHGGFNVVAKSAYRFASLVVPLLDGERRVDELCAGLGAAQRDLVYQLLSALYARGFVRDSVPGSAREALPPPVAERFAPQIDYLDHYADDAPGRFARFRSTPVAVLGGDGVARWAALGLLRNGCAAVAVTGGGEGGDPGGGADGVAELAEVVAEAAELEAAGCPARLDRLPPPGKAGPDGAGPAGAAPRDTAAYGWAELDGWQTVLFAGPDARRQLLRLLDEGIPPGRRLLGAWCFGERVVIGPVMTAGGRGCWCCAALRLGAAGDPADSAALWSSLGPAAPLGAVSPALPGPLAGMLGNLLAFEVFRLVTGALPAETRERLVIQDLDSLDVLSEPLLPHPRCPYCASPAGGPGDGTSAGAPPGALLRAPGPEDGPAGLPADGAADEAAARAALAELEDRAVLVQERAGVFTGYADEGWEQTPLKIGTVRLGTGPGRVREISAADVHHVAGARRRALLRAAEVYAEHVVPPPVAREAAAERVAPPRLAVSTGLDVPEHRVARWTPATSLLDGREVLLPTAAVRPLGGWNDLGGCERTPAGTGAGGSPRAALTRALRTALAYDALCGAVRRVGGLRVFDPASFGADPELLFLLRSAETLGVGVEVLDLTAATGLARPGALPVALARLTGPEDSGARWAVSAALRPREAVAGALRDLLGAEQLRAAGGPPDTGDPLWADLDAATLVPAGEPVPVPLEEGPVTGWGGVLDALGAAGRDAFAVPVHAPDLAAGRIHATRVLLTLGGRRAG